MNAGDLGIDGSTLF